MTLDTTSTLIKRIERVDLRVTDIQRALSFYRDIVGLEVPEVGPSQATLAAPEGPPLIMLTSSGVDAPASRSATGLYHTAIRFPDRGALANALARLVDAGLRIGASDHGFSEALYIDDPDGNGVELYVDRPRERWPTIEEGRRLPAMMAPLDLHGLLADASAGSNGAAPPGTDVGHVHLQVADIGRTTRFYVEVLGLDLMTEIAGQAGFFSSGGYHHHLGANVWNSRGNAPAPRNQAGLDRIVFAAETPDIEALYTRFPERGAAVDPIDGALEVVDPDGITLHFVPDRTRSSD